MQKNQSTLSNSTFSYFVYLLKKSIPYMVAYAIATLVFSGILIPNYFKSIIQSFNQIGLYKSFLAPYYGIYSSYSYFIYPLISILSIITALLSFKFLTSRQESDMVFSLPAKRSSLFISTYLAGLFSFLIPYIIIRNPLPLFAFANEFKTEELYNAINGYLINMLMECLLFLACYSFCVYLCVNIGKIFDVLLHYILLSVMLPICALGLFRAIIFNLLGIQAPSAYYSVGLTTVFSSLPELINSMFYSSNATPQRWITVLIYSVFFIAFTLLSCFLFKIRKTEKSSVPFAFSYIKIIFSILLSFLFGIIFSLIIANGNLDRANFYTTIPVFFIASFIVYLGVTAISKRSFMVFDAKVLFYLITAGIYGILIAYISTNGFGSVTFVPQVSNVKTVSISLYNDSVNNTYSYNENQSWGKNIDTEKIKRYSEKTNLQKNNMVDFSSTEAIEAVTAFHKNILNKYKEFDYSEKNISNLETQKYTSSSNFSSIPQYSSSQYSKNSSVSSSVQSKTANPIKNSLSHSPIYITYTLKDGTKIERRYNTYYSDWLDESYEKIKNLKSVGEKDSNIFYEYLEKNSNENNKNLNVLTYKGALPFDIETKIFPDLTSMKKILNAVYKDELTFKRAEDFNAKDYCVLGMEANINGLKDILNGNKLVIKENYKNTIAVLNEMGIKDFKSSDISGECVIEYLYFNYMDEKYRSMLISHNYEVGSNIFRTNYDNFLRDVWWKNQPNIHTSSDKALITSALKDISLTNTFGTFDEYFAVFKGKDTPPVIYCLKPSEQTKKLMPHLKGS